MQCEYISLITLKWFATESCIQLILHDNDKNHNVCHAKTVQNPVLFVMRKMSKISYFFGRILARILRSRKVYEVFHVCLHQSTAIRRLTATPALMPKNLLYKSWSKHPKSQWWCRARSPNIVDYYTNISWEHSLVSRVCV